MGAVDAAKSLVRNGIAKPPELRSVCGCCTVTDSDGSCGLRHWAALPSPALCAREYDLVMLNTFPNSGTSWTKLVFAAVAGEPTATLQLASLALETR